jgi:hypothetical protein
MSREIALLPESAAAIYICRYNVAAHDSKLGNSVMN